jgi:FtsH-binding integral membrane protein
MEVQPRGSRGGGGGGKPVAVDLMDDKPAKHHMLPVWFFIGLTLFLYGLIIAVTGIYELSDLPSTVLANLHAPIWWGAIMAVFGGFYVNKYRPRKFRP